MFGIPKFIRNLIPEMKISYLVFLGFICITSGLRASEEWVAVAHAISSGVEIPRAIRELEKETGKKFKILHLKKGNYPEDLADSFQASEFDEILDLPREMTPEEIAELLKKYSLKYPVLVGVEGILWPFEVNKILGLPTLDPKRAEVFLNKDLFYKYLQRPEFEIPQDSVNFAEILDWRLAVSEVETKRLHYPLGVKPSNDAAAHGFEVIYTPEELSEYAEVWLSGKKKTLDGKKINKLVIQPFFQGDHYSVQVVSSEGRFIVSDIFLHKKSHKIYFESILLSNSDSISRKLIKFLTPMIEDSPGTFALHIELADDPRYGFVPYDCGPRCMGGKEYYLVKGMRGINQQKWLVMAVLMPDLFEKLSKEGFYGHQIDYFQKGVLVDWVQHESGIVEQEPNYEWSQSLPAFYRNFSQVKRGMEIVRTESLVTSHGSTIFLGKSGDVEDSVLRFRAAERSGEWIKLAQKSADPNCNSTFLVE